MDPSSRTSRRILYAAGAIALLLLGRVFGARFGASTSSSSSPSDTPSEGAFEAPGNAASPPGDALAPLPVVRLRRPPSAVAELGILTNLSETDLAPLVDRAGLAALVRPADCGDEAACTAVRGALADEHTTTVQVLPASAWSVESADIDASALGLSPRERASVTRRARVVVVRVAGAPSSQQIAVRASFAAAAAIAEKVDGLVYDQLLARIESARGFAAHVVTAPLDASAFRKDRVQLLYEPRAEGIVRILTAGLARWGGPDVEAEAVPTAAADRVADIVLGVAESIANGAIAGPVTLSREDLARVRGEPYPPDDSMPPATPMALELLSVHPEGGDPNDFMARIQPPTGTGPLAFLDLSERFFGAELAAAPGEATLRAAREKAQRDLPDALARWAAGRAAGHPAGQDGSPALFVRLPFEIAGDGGAESMWIAVSRYDARSITGTLVDDPLAATRFARGDEVTRSRADVEELDARDAGSR